MCVRSLRAGRIVRWTAKQPAGSTRRRLGGPSRQVRRAIWPALDTPVAEPRLRLVGVEQGWSNLDPPNRRKNRNSAPAQTAKPPLSRAPENCPPPKQRWEVQVTPPPSHLLLPASRCRIPTSASRKCCCRSCMTSVCSGPTKRNYRRSFARRLRGHGNGWCHALHDGTACCRRGNLKMFDLNFV